MDRQAGRSGNYALRKPTPPNTDADEPSKLELPPGWCIVARPRRGGGRVDKYFHGPDGQQFRSIRQVHNFIENGPKGRKSETTLDGHDDKKRHHTNDNNARKRRKEDANNAHNDRQGKCLVGYEAHLKALAPFKEHLADARSALSWLKKHAESSNVIKASVPFDYRFPIVSFGNNAGGGGYADAFAAIGMYRTDKDLTQKHYHIWRFPLNFDFKSFLEALDVLQEEVGAPQEIGNKPPMGGGGNTGSGTTASGSDGGSMPKSRSRKPTSFFDGDPNLAEGHKPRSRGNSRTGSRVQSAEPSPALGPMSAKAHPSPPLAPLGSAHKLPPSTVIFRDKRGRPEQSVMAQPMNCMKLYSRNGEWFKPLRCKSCVAKKSEACRFLGVRALAFQMLSQGKLERELPPVEAWGESAEDIDDALAPGQLAPSFIRVPAYVRAWLQAPLLQLLEPEAALSAPQCLKSRIPGVWHSCDVCGVTVLYRYYLCVNCSLESCAQCVRFPHDTRRNSGVACYGNSVLVGYTTSEHLSKTLEFVKGPLVHCAPALAPLLTPPPPTTVVPRPVDPSVSSVGPGGVVRLHTNSLEAFQREWVQSAPVVITGMHQRVAEDWTPAGLMAGLGAMDRVSMMDTLDNTIVSHLTPASFFRGFGDARQRERDPVTGERMLLLMREYPPAGDVATALPAHAADLETAMAVAPYCTRQGSHNVETFSPSELLGPEAGPKLVIGYAGRVMPGGAVMGGWSPLRVAPTDWCSAVTCAGARSLPETDGLPQAFLAFCSHQPRQGSEDAESRSCRLNKEWRALPDHQRAAFIGMPVRATEPVTYPSPVPVSSHGHSTSALGALGEVSAQRELELEVLAGCALADLAAAAAACERGSPAALMRERLRESRGLSGLDYHHGFDPLPSSGALELGAEDKSWHWMLRQDGISRSIMSDSMSAAPFVPDWERNSAQVDARWMPMRWAPAGPDHAMSTAPEQDSNPRQVSVLGKIVQPGEGYISPTPVDQSKNAHDKDTQRKDEPVQDRGERSDPGVAPTGVKETDNNNNTLPVGNNSSATTPRSASDAVATEVGAAPVLGLGVKAASGDGVRDSRTPHASGEGVPRLASSPRHAKTSPALPIPLGITCTSSPKRPEQQLPRTRSPVPAMLMGQRLNRSGVYRSTGSQLPFARERFLTLDTNVNDSMDGSFVLNRSPSCHNNASLPLAPGTPPRPLKLFSTSPQTVLSPRRSCSPRTSPSPSLLSPTRHRSDGPQQLQREQLLPRFQAHPPHASPLEPKPELQEDAKPSALNNVPNLPPKEAQLKTQTPAKETQLETTQQVHQEMLEEARDQVVEQEPLKRQAVPEVAKPQLIQDQPKLQEETLPPPTLPRALPQLLQADPPKGNSPSKVQPVQPTALPQLVQDEDSQSPSKDPAPLSQLPQPQPRPPQQQTQAKSEPQSDSPSRVQAVTQPAQQQTQPQLQQLLLQQQLLQLQKQQTAQQKTAGPQAALAQLQQQPLAQSLAALTARLVEARTPGTVSPAASTPATVPSTGAPRVSPLIQPLASPAIKPNHRSPLMAPVTSPAQTAALAAALAAAGHKPRSSPVIAPLALPAAASASLPSAPKRGSPLMAPMPAPRGSPVIAPLGIPASAAAALGLAAPSTSRGGQQGSSTSAAALSSCLTSSSAAAVAAAAALTSSSRSPFMSPMAMPGAAALAAAVPKSAAAAAVAASAASLVAASAASFAPATGPSAPSSRSPSMGPVPAPGSFLAAAAAQQYSPSLPPLPPPSPMAQDLGGSIPPPLSLAASARNASPRDVPMSEAEQASMPQLKLQLDSPSTGKRMREDEARDTGLPPTGRHCAKPESTRPANPAVAIDEDASLHSAADGDALAEANKALAVWPDVLEMERQGKQVVAVWHIFRHEDARALREFLQHHSREQGDSAGDALAEGRYYLDAPLLARLAATAGIKPWVVPQCLGDTVLVPAGCASQVFNLRASIKVEQRFVSPEHAARCLELAMDTVCTKHSHSHAHNQKRDDKPQMRGMLHGALLHSLATLHPDHAVSKP